MDDDDRVVECATHGPQQATFVCQHLAESLRTGKRVGFWSSDDEENPRPDAWCDACEKAFQDAGEEWNDESEAFAGIKMLCGACYDRVRRINQSH